MVTFRDAMPFAMDDLSLINIDLLFYVFADRDDLCTEKPLADVFDRGGVNLKRIPKSTQILCVSPLLHILVR